MQKLSRGFSEVINTPGCPVVQLIHQSVKGYLVEKGLSALEGFPGLGPAQGN